MFLKGKFPKTRNISARVRKIMFWLTGETHPKRKLEGEVSWSTTHFRSFTAKLHLCSGARSP